MSARALTEVADKLYSAVVADVLDSLDLRDQVAHHELRPLARTMRVVGRAATMLAIEQSRAPAEPYELELELVDSLSAGDVVCCAVQGQLNCAVWGELLTTAARARGSRGAILDGLARDAAVLEEMGFPVFSRGLSPADSKGRCEVVAIRETIRLGGVVVNDGDLVVADADGCVAVPRAVEDEVLSRALAKVANEDRVRQILASGASLKSVFHEYGVL